MSNDFTIQEESNGLAGLAAIGFGIAGAIAAIGSAYANFLAFEAFSPGTMTGRTFGFLGIATTLIAFCAFTLVYWNLSQKRKWTEAVRALLVGLIASAAGVWGTMMCFDNFKTNQITNAQTVLEDRARLETQIITWRKELDAIPAETGDVESLQTYVDTLASQGKTHWQGYRMKTLELGRAKRRDALQDKVEAAEARLLDDPKFRYKPPQRTVNPLILALIMELFASQGPAVAAAAYLTMAQNRKNRKFFSEIFEDGGGQPAEA